MDESLAAMQCPEGGTGCSFEGVEYTADDKGVVNVPQEAVGVLLGFGFTIVTEESKAAKKGGK